MQVQVLSRVPISTVLDSQFLLGSYPIEEGPALDRDQKLLLYRHCVKLEIMRFDWDDDKAESNHRKHQVRFEEAQTVFLDSNAVDFLDSEPTSNERKLYEKGI